MRYKTKLRSYNHNKF